jgi:hypothetical protein
MATSSTPFPRPQDAGNPRRVPSSLTADEREQVEADLQQLQNERDQMLSRRLVQSQEAFRSRMAWLHRNTRQQERLKGMLNG